MVYLLYIIITLLIAIVYSLQQRIWQIETYHLENKYPTGKNKDMDNALTERDNRMLSMIWSQFVLVITISAIISAVIFAILFALQYFKIINIISF